MYYVGITARARRVGLSTFLLLATLLTACGGPGSGGPIGYQMGGSRQGVLLSLSTEVTTPIGDPLELPGSNDGTGADARFDNPHGITTDGTNLYVADFTNHTIRKIVIATGVVTTLAGSAGNPGAADDPTGLGTATFDGPWGITTDGTNLYVTEYYNHTIRQIVIATGAVTTIAGAAGFPGPTDAAPGTDARFRVPLGITTDGTNLYVADTLNYTIRQIVITTTAVTTLAGAARSSGDNDDPTGTNARFDSPFGITTDGTNLYVVDSSNYTIRQIVIATTAVTTIAGLAGINGSTDALLGEDARFLNSTAITTDGFNLYITDGGNDSIRQFNIATTEVSTVAGSAGSAGYADGTGADARFNSPNGITTDGRMLYVTDNYNNTIRQID